MQRKSMYTFTWVAVCAFIWVCLCMCTCACVSLRCTCVCLCLCLNNVFSIQENAMAVPFLTSFMYEEWKNKMEKLRQANRMVSKHRSWALRRGDMDEQRKIGALGLCKAHGMLHACMHACTYADTQAHTNRHTHTIHNNVTHMLSLSLSLSLSHTHTHTHTQRLITHTHNETHMQQCHTHTHIPTLSLTHSQNGCSCTFLPCLPIHKILNTPRPL